MSARKLRSSWWVDFRFAGVRYRKRSPMNTRAGAQAYEGVLRGRLAHGLPVDGAPAPKPLRLAEFAAEWLETYVRPNNRPTEMESKAMILRRHLLPRLGSTLLTHLTSRDVDAYKSAKLAAGLSPKTVNNHLAVLNKALASAVEWGHLQSAPRVQLLKCQPSPVSFLSREERDRLVAACGGQWRTMALIAAHTGMRIGEVIGLDVAAVDVGRGMISVRQAVAGGKLGPTKSGRERHIPMTAAVREAIAAHLDQHGVSAEALFRNPDGSRVTRAQAAWMLSRACRLAGMRRVGWHALRHTFASDLVMGNVPIRAVQVLLGHANVTMTERYSHLAPATMSDAVRMLETPPRVCQDREIPEAASGAPIT